MYLYILGNPFLDETSANTWQLILHPPEPPVIPENPTGKDKKATKTPEKKPVVGKNGQIPLATEQQIQGYYKSLYDTIYSSLLGNMTDAICLLDQELESENMNNNLINDDDNKNSSDGVNMNDIIRTIPCLQEQDVTSNIAFVNFNFKTFYQDSEAPSTTTTAVGDATLKTTFNTTTNTDGQIDTTTTDEEEEKNVNDENINLYDEVYDKHQEEALLPIVELVVTGVTNIICLCEYTEIEKPAENHLIPNDTIHVIEFLKHAHDEKSQQQKELDKYLIDKNKELHDASTTMHEKLDDMYDRLNAIRIKKERVSRIERKRLEKEEKIRLKAEVAAAKAAKALLHANKITKKKKKFIEEEEEEEEEEDDDDDEEEEYFKVFKIIYINSLAELKAILHMNQSINTHYLHALPLQQGSNIKEDENVYIYIVNIASPSIVPSKPTIPTVIYNDDDIDVDIGQDEADMIRINSWNTTLHKVNVLISNTANLPLDKLSNTTTTQQSTTSTNSNVTTAHTSPRINVNTHQPSYSMDCYCDRYMAIQDICQFIYNTTNTNVLWIESNLKTLFPSFKNNKSHTTTAVESTGSFLLSSCCNNIDSSLTKRVVSKSVYKYLLWMSCLRQLPQQFNVLPQTDTTAITANTNEQSDVNITNTASSLIQYMLSPFDTNTTTIVNTIKNVTVSFLLGGTISFQKLLVLNDVINWVSSLIYNIFINMIIILLFVVIIIIIIIIIIYKQYTTTQILT